MPKNKVIREVSLFVLIAFLYSWPIFFLVDAWLDPMFWEQGNQAASHLSVLTGHLLAMLGPAVAALLMWRLYHKEPLPAWKWSQPKYYAWAALAMLAFWALPGLIGLVFGAEVRSPIETSTWIRIAMMLAFGWIAGMGEEIGWCAYLLSHFSPIIGKTRALILSGVIRGLWHWPVVVAPIMAQVAAGERTMAELIGASIVIAIQLAFSNMLFGAIFGWIWYRTESIPLVGWLHFWYDLVRDVTVMLIMGYASGLWMTLNGFVLFPLGFICLDLVLKSEGLTWKQFFGREKLAPSNG